MGMIHNSAVGMSEARTLTLSFGSNRLYLVGRREAPLWMRKRGPWMRPLTVSWHRLEHGPGHWWVAQQGQMMVILGLGTRPALLLECDDPAWQALVPAGHQSTMVMLPDAGRYTARPARSGTWDRRSTPANG